LKRELPPTVWLIFAVVYMVLTFVLSSISFGAGIISQFRAYRPDLILHFLEYAILAILLLKYLGGAGWLSRSKLSWWLPVIIGGVVGGANELFQFYIPYRFPSVSDALVNLVGAGIPVLWVRFYSAPFRIKPEEL